MQAKKSLGQTFLRDRRVLKRIADRVKDEERIVEIGAGHGELTQYLISVTKHLRVVEIDKELVKELESRFRGIEIERADARRYKLRGKNAVVGNLPYNMAKRIIYNFISQRELVTKMVFMVQREVASAMTASCGDSDYSKFSVFVQTYCTVKKLFDVPPEAFVPQPKVYSSVVELIPYRNEFVEEGVLDEHFMGFLRVLFSKPRKTVRNNLRPLFELSGDRAALRPGDLSLGDIYNIYKEYKRWRSI